MKIHVLVLCCILNFVNYLRGCEYEVCPPIKADMLNVHLICHTHNDVGWLKTVDQYFYGANQSVQRAGVQYILDSVLDALLKNPNRRFIYVETAFFWRWWEQQSNVVQDLMRKMVMTGQLEFISGGWSMNDEGAAHYNAIIDQMTVGFRKLHDTFGKCGVPRIGWQIDPFGHSAEQASLFAQMNFDGYFLGRIDYQDKDNREINRNMEFVWKGSRNLGRAGEIFTSILPNTYSPPAGFCFDVLCDDQPIMDDPRLEGYNVEDRVKEFMKIASNEAKVYRTNHITMTMGNDFNYQNAQTWFKNLDKLVYYVNKEQVNGSKINVLYSTPSCYINALNNIKETWTTKSDDFFPYASDPHAFWTGYFTSRPSVKGYFRQANNILQICKQLFTMASLTPKYEIQLNILKEALGVAQHHDAITGTAKQTVTDDYVKRVAKGVTACQDVINNAYIKLMPVNQTVPPWQSFCNYLNISECTFLERKSLIAVTIYNPLAKQINYFVRLPVLPNAYKVLNHQGVPVTAQLNPIPKSVFSIPGRKSNSSHELIFMATLPPLGYTTYFVKSVNNKSLLSRQIAKDYNSKNGKFILRNEHLSIYVSKNIGILSAIRRKDGLNLSLNQSYYWYRGMNGNNTDAKFRASGAYIFRPNGTDPIPLGNNVTVQCYKGQVVDECHHTFNSWVSQVVRLYKNTDYVELEWLVGPVPVNDGVGKEIITRFDSDLNTDSFYTDANGREMQKRVLNYRPTWKLNLSEPVSGNYYPINSRIYIKDENKDIQITVLTDRSQGGSSLNNGSIELMVHRRLLHDDAFGVGEPLNEPGVDGKGLVVRGKHYLIVSDINSAAVKHRELAEKVFLAPLMSFSTIDSVQKYAHNFHTQITGLNREIPSNVHLLTLEPWKDSKLLMRLEHMFENDEDPKNFSKTVNVSLDHLFKFFNISTIREMTLGANQYKNSISRKKWNTRESSVYQYDENIWKETIIKTVSKNITLSPMQIRTFELNI